MKSILSRFWCWLIAIFFTLKVSAQSQTFGSTFLQMSQSEGVTITQSIGQPYAVFKSEQTKSGIFYQGQLLPVFQELSLPETKIELSVFPNPVEEVLNLRISTTSKLPSYIDGIRVMDLNGRVMNQTHGAADFSIQEIDVSSLSPGIYILSVRDSNDNEASIKFSKISSPL